MLQAALCLATPFCMSTCKLHFPNTTHHHELLAWGDQGKWRHLLGDLRCGSKFCSRTCHIMESRPRMPLTCRCICVTCQALGASVSALGEVMLVKRAVSIGNGVCIHLWASTILEQTTFAPAGAHTHWHPACTSHDKDCVWCWDLTVRLNTQATAPPIGQQFHKPAVHLLVLRRGLVVRAPIFFGFSCPHA